MPADTQTMYAGIIVRMNNAAESVMFPTLVTDALTKIASTPTGRKLLTGIAAKSHLAKFGFTVCIIRADMRYDAGCVTRWVGTNVAKRGDEAAGTTRGQASITAIKYNANMIDTPDGKRPSWIGLAHELIHAYYNLKGKGRPDSEEEFNVSGNVKKEEMLTVGLGAGPHRSITENQIRAEAGLALRTTYGGN